MTPASTIEPSPARRSFEIIRKSVKDAFVEIEENFVELVIEDTVDS